MKTRENQLVICFLHAHFFIFLLGSHFYQFVYLSFFLRMFVQSPIISLRAELLKVSLCSEISNIFKKCLFLHDSFNIKVHLNCFTIAWTFGIFFMLRTKGLLLLFTQTFFYSLVLFSPALFYIDHRMIFLFELD